MVSGCKMNSIFDLLSERKAGAKPKRLALVGGESVYALQACKNSMDKGLVRPVLIGDTRKIEVLMRAVSLSNECQMVHARDSVETAAKAVEMVKERKVDILMKGQIETNLLLKAVLDRKSGIRSNGLLSAVSLFEYKQKPLLITDAAINIKPDLAMKADIIKNVIDVARGLGIPQPKVAVLAPIEKVNPHIIETTHAQALSEMSRKGEFGDAVVDGPISLDLAMSVKSARQKKYNGSITGDADVLLAPDLMSANLLHKAFALLTDYPHSAVVSGSSVPLIINSRSENEITKFNSIAMASYLAGKNESA